MGRASLVSATINVVEASRKLCERVVPGILSFLFSLEQSDKSTREYLPQSPKTGCTDRVIRVARGQLFGNSRRSSQAKSLVIPTGFPWSISGMNLTIDFTSTEVDESPVALQSTAQPSAGTRG